MFDAKCYCINNLTVRAEKILQSFSLDRRFLISVVFKLQNMIQTSSKIKQNICILLTILVIFKIVRVI